MVHKLTTKKQDSLVSRELEAYGQKRSKEFSALAGAWKGPKGPDETVWQQKIRKEWNRRRASKTVRRRP